MQITYGVEVATQRSYASNPADFNAEADGTERDREIIRATLGFEY